MEIKGIDGEPPLVRAVVLMNRTQNLSPVALEAISEMSVALVEQPGAREVFEDGSQDLVVQVLQSISTNYLHDKLA